MKPKTIIWSPCLFQRLANLLASYGENIITVQNTHPIRIRHMVNLNKYEM